MGDGDTPRHREGVAADEPPGSASQGVDDGIRDTLMTLLTLQQRFRRHMEDRLGVDAAGLTTMIHLSDTGSDSPTAIARTLETSTAATSLVLNRLEASGHISRQPHPTDRRKVVVVASPASLASAYACANPVIDGINGLAASLTDDERETVAAFLRGLVQVYDDALRDRK